MLKPITSALLIFLLAGTTGAAEPQPPERPFPLRGGPRVRPYDARAASLLLQGIERSRTMRTIVDELDRRDVIAYIEMRPVLGRNLAGAVTFLATAGNYRYVRISLHQGLNTEVAIATLGHELQHALEIARQPTIVDTASLEAYYMAHGISMRSHGNGWDTIAARVIGDDVRREIADVRTSRVAESIQTVNPEDWHVVYRRARSMLPP